MCMKFFKYWIDKQAIGVLNEAEAKALFNTGIKRLNVTDSLDNPSFIIRTSNGESRKGIGGKPDFTEIHLLVLDDALNVVFDLTYKNIFKENNYSKNHFFLINILVTSWDDESKIHGKSLIFNLFKIEDITSLEGKITSRNYKLLDEIKVSHQLFNHGKIIDKNSSEIPILLKKEQLVVCTEFGNWQDLIIHKEKILPIFENLARNT